MRSLIFLLTSFISAIGDTLLVFAVPVGLGLDNEDIRMAILMWLIPAIAMYSSSFFVKFISNRIEQSRKDYALLLLGLSIVEIVTAGIAISLESNIAVVIATCIFVFFYAFAKEGIPKIFFDVSVYRYFVSEQDYAKTAGMRQSLNILAHIVGGLFATYLLTRSDWRISLIYDAATFLIFGIAILFYGKDKVVSSEKSLDEKEQEVKVRTKKELKYLLKSINIIVPLFFALNALGWNYLALIAKKLNVVDIQAGLLALTFLKVPGMLLGFRFERVASFIGLKNLIVYVPILFFSSVILFLGTSQEIFYYTSIFAYGLLAGLYFSADTVVRSQLPNKEMIDFNGGVLKRLSSFQFVACCMALICFSYQNFIPYLLLSILLVSIVIISTGLKSTSFKRLASLCFCCVVMFSFFTSCQKEESELNVVLPALNKDLRLRTDLTYSAMAILNSTSARLVYLNKDLDISQQVMLKSITKDYGKKITLHLAKNYRSARGENITAEDLLYTIKLYLSDYRSFGADPFINIVGSEKCKEVDCVLDGAKVTGSHTLEINLKKPDLNLVEKLSSPWVILGKKGKPKNEQIGDCEVPYQTGTALIIACDQKSITLKAKGKKVRVWAEGDHPRDLKNIAKLHTNNPANEIRATLTVMSAFYNPSSKALNDSQRAQLMENIRFLSKEMSRDLKLAHSKMLVSEWLSVPPSQKLSGISYRDITCPERPIKILLDSSLPSHKILKTYLSKASKCKIDYSHTTSNRYFENFAKNDIGIAWFTPDFLTLSDVYSIYDCHQRDCYFSWNDDKLQSLVSRIKDAAYRGERDKEGAILVEEYVLEKGYAAPISNINWWIVRKGSFSPIHPAGLFQLKIEDFVNG